VNKAQLNRTIQIQEEIINPAIQPYNDAEYSIIYSDNSMGNF